MTKHRLAHVQNDQKITTNHILDIFGQPLSFMEASSAIKAMYCFLRPPIEKISPLYYILYPIVMLIKCPYFFDWNTFTMSLRDLRWLDEKARKVFGCDFLVIWHMGLHEHINPITFTQSGPTLLFIHNF